MAKTVALENLADDAQRAFDELLSPDEPVMLSRNGQTVGALVGYDLTLEPDSAEQATVQAAIAQGEEDYATGRCLPLGEFKMKHAAKLNTD